MIPRILHQTWRSADIPAHLRGFHESWRRLHPDWEFRAWFDDDNASLLADLHRHGGVYADLDYEALRPFDPLLETRGQGRRGPFHAVINAAGS